MEDLVWTAAMSVGIAPLDEDHRQLILLLRDLRENIAGRNGVGALPYLHRLADYAKGHFAKEEAILRAGDYPAFAAHQSIHEAMVQDIAEALTDQAQSPDPDLAAKLYTFVLNWLKSHILEDDMAYARYFANKDRRSAAQ